MRYTILEPQVSFRFDNPAGSGPVHQDGSQQRSGNLDRGPIIERARKRRGHVYSPCLHLNFAVEHHVLELELVFDGGLVELGGELHFLVLNGQRRGLGE